MKPRLAVLGARLSGQRRDAHGHSRAAEPWRKWYSLKRWADLRIATFVRDLFTCQMQGCGRLEPNTSLLVADHQTPHRGDPRLFWDPDNVWTLCKRCHDRIKQAEEARGKMVGAAEVGG